MSFDREIHNYVGNVTPIKYDDISDGDVIRTTIPGVESGRKVNHVHYRHITGISPSGRNKSCICYSFYGDEGLVNAGAGLIPQDAGESDWILEKVDPSKTSELLSRLDALDKEHFDRFGVSFSTPLD